MEPQPALFRLATAYHHCRDVDSLLKTFLAHMGPQAGARAALAWLVSESGEVLICRGRWFEAGERFEPADEPATEGVLAEMLEATRARRLRGDDLPPDELPHLQENDRERVRNALYAPLAGARGPLGVVELLNKKKGEFTPEEAIEIEKACHMTGPPLETLLAAEAEGRQGFATIERLTSLYDISRIFNSTLELDDLLPVMVEKIRDILGAEACNLWLVDSEENDLYFAQQVGEDATTGEEDRLGMGEGLIGQVAEKGEGRVIEDATEEEAAELLAPRQQKSNEFRLQTLMAAPLMKEEEVIGVVEVVNKQDGSAYDEDDLFFLTSIAEQAAIALNNANLLAAERKVHELDALLAISKEITSTLDLDHVLTTVVHQAATVVPFDRCSIALFDRHRFILGAVSGEAEVPKTRETEQLRALLEWVAGQEEAVSADNYDEGWKVEPPGADSRVVPYLQAQEYNGFYAIPLRDDQGTVGVLALESGDAEFLSENHHEVLTILASQTTVAIRNARLYQEVPLVSFWQPIVERKRKLQAVPYGQWLEWGWKVGLVALLLVLIPWPMRVGANATVVPADRREVASLVEGTVEEVLVREGELVEAGAVLARLDDGENRVRLERARADLARARRELAEAEAERELGAASQARLRIRMHEAEVKLYREKVEQARLRAPITGVVVTPKVEEKAGEWVEAGETFCELVDRTRMAAEMNVPETKIDLVQAGNPAGLKLNAYPTVTFHGQVERVSAQTITAEGEQFFVVRAVFTDPQARFGPGMAGRGKITAEGGWFESGWYPVGYVWLRSPVQWFWRKTWTWIP